MPTLRGIQEKIETGKNKDLIKIALIQTATKALKGEGEENKKLLAIRILANPDWFTDRIYVMVMADDRMVDDAPDSDIIAVVSEVVSYFENING
jgi:hypothetical protein